MTSPERSRALPAGLCLVQERGFVRPAMLEPLDSKYMNLSGIRIQGIGGLGLMAIVVLISFTMPAAWWLVAIGFAGGLVLGLGLVMRRRRIGFSSDDGPTTIFGGSSASAGSGVGRGADRGRPSGILGRPLVMMPAMVRSEF